MRMLIAIALLGAQALHAQNLVTNPDFDTSIEQWQLSGIGTISHVADDGAPAPGALRLDRPDEARGNSTLVLSACIPVDKGMHFDLIGNIKLIEGSSANISAIGYSDAGCSTVIGTVGPVLTTSTADGTWQAFSATDFVLPDNVGSIIVRLSAGVGFPETLIAALFDHVGFGPTGSVPVTLQSFRID